jgi:phosphatidylserine decarboxylase
MTLLAFLNKIIAEGPSYEAGLIGFPINAVMDRPMGTPSGFAAFSDRRVNAQLKKMFDVWSTFLTSSASCHVLTTDKDGWLGTSAMKLMPNFVRDFECDPLIPHFGFTSWDDYFTRRLRSGARPVAAPEDDNVIVSACESTTYCIATDVKTKDAFWLKGEPYSVAHMLNHDELALHFIGGTVYQAFLGVSDYHRWHSPVNGRIVKTVHVPGSYYVESPTMGSPKVDSPDAPANLSQAFMTAINTRALVFIEADSSAIGLMCFIAVGMAEVSTCQFTVAAGDEVRKGEQIGMFHFGGSAHCLVFGPQVKLEFVPTLNSHVKLSSALARVLT